MHLLVETNFLLEVILGQEQVAACEKLLQAVEAGILTLHLPAFSLMEAVYKLSRLDEERGELQRQVQNQLGQAERESGKKQELQQMKREFTTVLEERNLWQQEKLRQVGQQMLVVSQQIPLTEAIWQLVHHLRDTTELTLPDAIVAASLLHRAEELGSEEKIFVTRDKKGFRPNEIKQLFEEQQCTVLLSFEHACQRLQL